MLRHLLVPTLAAALGAGEASATPVTASLAFADGPALVQHWEASLYATVWNDPGLAWVRQQWDVQKAGWKTAPGFDLDALLAAATGMRGEFLGLTAGPHPRPILRAQADFAAQTVTLFALWTAEAKPAEVAGADEARQLGRDGPVLARHGTRLVLGWNCAATPWPAGPVPVDGRLVLDYRRFMQAMLSAQPAGKVDNADDLLRQLGPLLGTLTWDLSLVPQGLREALLYDVTFGVKPVDRTQLDRFPAEALAVAGLGVDLAAMWKAAGPVWLDSLDQAMHHGKRLGVEATRKELDALLIGLGIAGGVQQLVGEVTGTCTLAVTASVPFPAVSVSVPRSPAVDALIASVLTSRLGAEVPAEGAASILPIPDLPVMISLARDRTHWLLSSDALVVESWLTGKPGGFLGSATGKAMLAKAPADAYLLGGMDSAAVLRLAIPFAAMGMAPMRGMPKEVRPAILAGLNRLARESTPSWLWSAEQGKGNRTEAEGVLGLGVMPIAIIAAIAIPNLLESRVAANEAATAATLKSGIFPAQIQFQAGGYMDQDADNVGEYGTLAELSGRLKTNKIEAGALKLLAGPLAAGNTAYGHHFRMYLPDGAGGALTSDEVPRATGIAAASDAQEQYFAVYAWPQSTETGRKMFVLTQDGQVRSLPWDGSEPAWDAALGNGWDGEATWPLLGQGRPGRRAPAAPAPVQQPDPKNMF